MIRLYTFDNTAGKSTRVSFSKRYLTALCIITYGMLMGCVRTATLGVAAVMNPITGKRGFASDLSVDVDAPTLRALRIACAAALVVFG